MKEAKVGGTSFADGGLKDDCWPLISNLVSLVRHVETSMAFCELAKDAHSHEESTANIAVLDDVTPRYVTANTALIACDVQLRETLRVLLQANAASGTRSPAKM
jgi:hypothetical protein